jgi:hypothetical protein
LLMMTTKTRSAAMLWSVSVVIPVDPMKPSAEMVADGAKGVHLFDRLFLCYGTEGDQTARSTQASAPSSVLLQPGSWQIPRTTDINEHATWHRSANTLCSWLPSLPPSISMSLALTFRTFCSALSIPSVTDFSYNFKAGRRFPAATRKDIAGIGSRQHSAEYCRGAGS